MWGDRFTPDDQPLIRLADLVRLLVALTERSAIRRHATALVDRLAAAWPVALFQLIPGGDAAALPGDVVWRARYPSGPERRKQRIREERQSAGSYGVVMPHSWFMSDDECFARGLAGESGAFGDGESDTLPELVELRGAAGLIEWLRHCWAVMGNSLADLDSAENGRPASIAMLEADAVRLFPELFPQVAAGTDARQGLADERVGAVADQLVQPEGGQWPHVDGQAWTESERAALFLMRHRDKRTGEDLAGIAGVKRQRIDELIGPARPHGGLSAVVAKDGWTPTAALLAACGQPLQPLQSAALAMAS